ncbi:MAG TPA: hypothetical protein VII61_17930 [Ktedonobacteraceae bacterium]
MAEKEEFFLPEEVDRQIESVSQLKEGDQRDAEALAYLRNVYQADARQEQETLDRIWNRISGANLLKQDTQGSEKEPPMQISHNISSLRQSRSQHSPLMQRLGLLAAVVFLVAIVGSMAIVFYAVRHPNGSGASPNPTSALSAVHVPLKVTSVSMSVTPGSIASFSCGTNVTVTYTAIFYVGPKSIGGTVQFYYTVNNGRGQTSASITFSPGQTVQTYTFTWSGALPADHTYPEPGDESQSVEFIVGCANGCV